MTYVRKQRAGQKEYGNKSLHEKTQHISANQKMTIECHVYTAYIDIGIR